MNLDAEQNQKVSFLLTGSIQADLAWLGALLNQIPGIHCEEQGFTNSAKIGCRFESLKLDESFAQLQSRDEKCLGQLTSMTLFDAQSKSLSEKSQTNFVRPNLLIDPAAMVQNRYDYLLGLYNQYGAGFGKRLLKNPFLDPIYGDVTRLKSTKNVEFRGNIENMMWASALTCLDQVDRDLFVPTEKFNAERLKSDAEYFCQFVRKISRNTISPSAKDVADRLPGQSPRSSCHKSWPDWVFTAFGEKMAALKLIRVFQELNFDLDYLPSATLASEPIKSTRGPLVSIQMNSNRPGQFSWFLDSIEQTVDSVESCEVLIHIDEGDSRMEETVLAEIKKRPFPIKYLKTNLVKSFADLWKPLNELYKLTDPNAYYVINLPDEILFTTPGWDTKIREFVGYYPDHIFRLRASQFRYRNYHDLWECGYAPDGLTFFTKRWLDISGDWNPCLGPDSFQQCVAYHLTRMEPFFIKQIHREIPLYDIRFTGEGASFGLTQEAHKERVRIHYKAWFILMGHKVQEEAYRRATLMRAHIVAHSMGDDPKVVSDSKRKVVQIVRPSTGAIVAQYSYALSVWRYGMRNSWRRLGYYYYGGGGAAGHPIERAKRLLRRTISSLLYNYVFRFSRTAILGPGHWYRAVMRRLHPTTEPLSE